MKELLIFLIIFAIIFSISVAIFNGRFIHSQIKYSIIGPPPVTPFNDFTSSLPLSGDNVLRLIIPLIGIDVPIVLAQTSDEFLVQKDLEKGVVRYPNSNVILGHSSAYPWYKGDYGSVFSLLNKLEQGTKILIYSNNNKFTYKVLDKKIDMPKNFNLENDDSIIYLVSCWPVSTNWKRIVIKAQLLDK